MQTDWRFVNFLHTYNHVDLTQMCICL